MADTADSRAPWQTPSLDPLTGTGARSDSGAAPIRNGGNLADGIGDGSIGT